ncbi:PKD domain-containing protein [Flavihumibacter stibioxidans]|uniref:PKD domain-containing protein n=1 Tax=Flavihumibacter stibioxidans TaxID=1834163 RepID=A0ABR7M544_9BACT|nr:PKD domain-containing protein [Flavihumibacter stibioxidans]MBC6490140.1 hypothetical protein [Flavihumibacter stibioxidans]
MAPVTLKKPATRVVWLLLFIVIPGLFSGILAQAPATVIRVDNANRQDPDTLSICINGSLNFADGSFGTPIKWSWTFSNGSPASSTVRHPGQVRFSVAGIQKVSLVSENLDGKDTAFFYVDVKNIKPVPDFSFSPNNNCGNIPVKFSNSSSGASRYLWRFGDEDTSIQKDPSHQYLSLTGSGTVTVQAKLIAYNQYGCSDSVQKPVTVLKVPDASLVSTDLDVQLVTFSGRPTFKKCSNEENYVFHFKNGSNTNASITRWEIDWGDGSPKYAGTTLPDTSHPFKLGNTVMTVSAFGADGCIGIKKYNVFLGTNPAGGIGSPGNTTICGPQTLSFPITGTSNNPPGTQYQIVFNDGSPTWLQTHPAPGQIDHEFVVGSCGVSSSNGSNIFQNSFKVTLDIINPCGISSSTVTPIYVSAKPQPLIGISPDSIVCVNSTATISDISRLGNFITVSGANSTCETNSGTAWKVYPATGWTTASGKLGSHNNSLNNYRLWNNGSSNLGLRFTVPGNYTVTLYKANECGVDSITRIICVREQPKASFTLNKTEGCGPLPVAAANTSPLPLCGENIFTWEITRLDPENCDPAGGTGYTYTNGTSKESLNPSWNFSLPGKYLVRLRVQAAGNSAASCSPDEFTDTVTIKAKPKLGISAPATICVGQTIQPTVSTISCYGNSVAGYEWTFTGGLPATAGTVVPGDIRYSTAGTYSIALKAANECGSSTVNTPVQVVALPAASAGKDLTVCSGDQVTLGSPAISGYSYLWQPATGLSGPVAAQPVFSVANNTGTNKEYQLVLTVKAGSGANACANSDTVNITVKPAPAVVVIPTSATVCVGDSVLLQSSGAKSYSWSPSPGLNLASGDSVWAGPSTTTTYTVTGTDTSGCRSSATATITVKPLPPADAGNNLALCLVNENIILTGGIIPGGVWIGTGISAGSGGYNFNPFLAGIGNHKAYYTVTQNGCTATDSTLISVSGQEEAKAGADQTVCQNSGAIQLSGLPSGGSWSGSGLVTGSGLFTPAQAGVFTLKYSYGAGSCQVTDELVITVLPGIENNIIRNRQDICVGSTPQLLTGSVPTGGDSSKIFQWQISQDSITWTNIIGASGKDYQPEALTGLRYFRRLVSSTLCNGLQVSTSNIIDIVPHGDAIASFSAAKNISCSPFQIDQSIITTDIQPDLNGSYWWFVNNNPLNTNSSPVFPGYTINANNDSVSISLVVRSQWGCASDTTTAKFVTIAGTTASFTKDSSEGCAPISIRFTNTSSRLDGVQFNWDFGDGQTSDSAQPDAILYRGSQFGNDTTYVISLSVSNGCETSVYKDSVQVRPLPKAIFGIDTTAGCSPFKLRINNTSKGGSATYYWDFGDGNTMTTTNKGVMEHVYTSGTVDTFTIKMRMVTECGEDSLAYNIVVSPNQIQPQVAVNGNQLYGCTPHTVTIINTTPGASRFEWNFDDGSPLLVSDEIPQTLTHTYTDTGTFNISVRMTNGCSDTVIYRQVIVLPGPTAGFEPITRPYCERDSVRFTNTSKQADAYLWNFGDGKTSILASPVHRYEQPGKYWVILVAYNSNPFGNRCSDTIRQEIEVLANPVASILTNAGTLNCAPFTLNATTNPAGALNANWYFDDPNDPTPAVGFTASHTFTKGGTYRIKLLVYNAAGCVDSSFTLIRVQYSPETGFNPLNTITCSTDSTISFTNTTTYEGTDLTGFRWLIDSIPVNTNRNLNYRFRLPQGELLPKTYAVTLISTSSIGCADTSYGSVRMNPTPVASFSIQNDRSCVPFAPAITNNSQFADDFRWYLDDSLVSADRTPGNIQLLRANSNYRLRLIASNRYGCDPDTMEQVITTAPKPVAGFALSDSLGCTGVLDVRMTNNSVGASRYEWQFGDQTPSVNTQNVRHFYGQSGEYDVLLIADNGICRDTATKIIRVGIKPIAAFEVDTAQGCKLLTVNFRNLSTNATAYMWDFDDGNFSGSENPVHSFGFINSPYTIRMIARGTYGCEDTAVRLNYITVKTAPTASFRVLPSPVIEIPDYTFEFLDQSTDLKSPDYKWYFGDQAGVGSTIPSPTYTYKDTGIYQVKMIVINKDDFCSDTASLNVQIMGIPGWLQVPNAFQPGSARTELNRFIPKGTGLKEYRLQIYNAWGELVFETNKLDDKGRPVESWDGNYKGQGVQQDVFTWRIVARFLNGTEWKGMRYPGNDQYKRVGTITVIK